MPCPRCRRPSRTVWDVLETNLGVGAVVARWSGLVTGIWRRPRLMLLTIPWFVLPVWFLLGYENADIDRYYLVPIMVAVVWAGLALDWAWDVALLGWRRLRPGGDRTSRRSPRRSSPSGRRACCWCPCCRPCPRRYRRGRRVGRHRRPDSSSTRPSPRSSRTRSSSAGGATPRRCGTAAGWRAPART